MGIDTTKAALNYAIIVLIGMSLCLMHLDHIEYAMYFMSGAIFTELKIIELRGDKDD